MSLFKRCFANTFTYKNIASCCYLLRDCRLNCVQYYTCWYNCGDLQSGIFKYKRLRDESKRTMSVVQSLRETNYNLSLKLKSFTDNFPTYLPFFGLKYKKLGYLWFNTLEEINTEDFFTLLDLSDTFYSRFQIIELHVWMLLYHLPSVGRINHFIRVGIIEAMWEDSQKRARMVAEINKNFKKNFRSLYGEFLFSQLLYDLCFAKSDATLGSAVWCCFLNKGDVDPRIIEALVYYIRYQMNHLDKLNFTDLTTKTEKGKIWAPARPIFEEILKKE